MTRDPLPALILAAPLLLISLACVLLPALVRRVGRALCDAGYCPCHAEEETS